MNASPFYRKRELSPRQRACLSLGLPIATKPTTNLDSRLHRAGIRDKAIEYLVFSEDPQAQGIVALYNSLNETERKAVNIDYLIMAAGADVHHVWGVIQEEVSRVQGMQAGIMAQAAMTDVVKVTIQRALRPDGIKAQQLLFDLARGDWSSSSSLWKERGF